MKPVPEEKKAPTREVQLQKLREFLMGNQVFANQRGQWSPTTLGQIAEHLLRGVDTIISPTQAQNELGTFFKNASIMFKRLSVYKRDGWKHAFEELWRALVDRCYVIAGEEIPLEKTVPVTLFMLKPEKTLMLIKWLIGVHDITELDKAFSYRCDVTGTQRFELTNQLIAEFPQMPFSNMDEAIHRTTLYLLRLKRGVGIDRDEHIDLLLNYNVEVIDPFPQVRKWLNKLCTLATSFCLPIGPWESEVNHHHDSPHSKDEKPRLAFMVREEQSEVLKLFDRADQKSQVATWQFDLPEAIWPSLVHQYHPSAKYNLAFYTEREHTRHKSNHPALTSKGISHGYGVTLINDRDGYSNYFPERPEIKDLFDEEANAVVNKYVEGNPSFLLECEQEHMNF